MVTCFDIGPDKLYDFFTIYISSLALLIYNLCQYREKRLLLCGVSKSVLTHCQMYVPGKVKQLTRVLVVSEIVLISLFQHGLVSVLNKLVGNLLQTGANYFGMIFAMPILLSLYCWLVGLDPLEQIDLITPAYPLALLFMKLGCFCAGCCEGIVCDFGVNNQITMQVEFPVQLVEAATALLLFFFTHFYRKKIRKGTLLPVYIILYCGLRFFSEFLRAEPELFGPLKLYHILCLAGLLYGLAQYAFLRFCRPVIDRIFANNLPVLVQNSR